MPNGQYPCACVAVRERSGYKKRKWVAIFILNIACVEEFHHVSLFTPLLPAFLSRVNLLAAIVVCEVYIVFFCRIYVDMDLGAYLTGSKTEIQTGDRVDSGTSKTLAMPSPTSPISQPLPSSTKS